MLERGRAVKSMGCLIIHSMSKWKNVKEAKEKIIFFFILKIASLKKCSHFEYF